MQWRGGSKELPTFVTELLSHCCQGGETREGALTLTLSGDLGAGKTTFVQALAAQLGVREVVRSPTFVIQKVYELPHDSTWAARCGLTHLAHIDAYRLSAGSELKQLGFSRLVHDRSTCIVLEWPEHVSAVLPDEYVALTFTVLDEHTRQIVLT
jgi:tRNA threonylcarbamoyladenosine biosynthesis protein TsaE